MSADMTGDQRTDDWYKERLGKATASRFKDIMTKVKSGESASRKNYRAELVAERLTGEKADGYTSKEMQHGIDYEDAAKLAYWLETKNVVIDNGFFVHDTLQAGASPDGLIGDDGIIEIKCPNTATHIQTLISQKVPSQYYWQIMGQLWITGRKWVDFVSYDPRLPSANRLFIKRVERNQQDIDRLAEEVAKFLQELDKEEQFLRNEK